MAYEYHRFDDPALRMFLHKHALYKPSFFPNYTTGDIPQNDDSKFPLKLTKFPEIFMHWHESPELLYVTEGCLSVKTDSSSFIAEAGSIAVIDGNQMHSLTSETPLCVYYCLIPNITMCGEFSSLPSKNSDPDVISLYNKIIKEYTTRDKNYIRLIKSYVECIFALLARCCDENPEADSGISAKLVAVKTAMSYISNNFKSDISIDDIAKSANLSRYYLCHVFKEITGQTVLSHLNYVRCNHACDLLLSGKYTVSQSASMSGFNNLSYFSKIYRATMGHLPSKDARK